MDPWSKEVLTTRLNEVDNNLPTGKTLYSRDEVVAKLKGENSAGVCNISVELLKTGGTPMISGLHTVLTNIGEYGNIIPVW